MGLLTALKNVWRKNAPEAFGLWNGASPDFVIRRRARSTCIGVPVFSSHLVDVESFEADLQFLATDDYANLRAAGLIEYLKGTRDLTRHWVLLTFDDGPRNLFEVARGVAETQRTASIHYYE